MLSCLLIVVLSCFSLSFSFFFLLLSVILPNSLFPSCSLSLRLPSPPPLASSSMHLDYNWNDRSIFILPRSATAHSFFFLSLSHSFPILVQKQPIVTFCLCSSPSSCSFSSHLIFLPLSHSSVTVCFFRPLLVRCRSFCCCCLSVLFPPVKRKGKKRPRQSAG